MQSVVKPTMTSADHATVVSAAHLFGVATVPTADIGPAELASLLATPDDRHHAACALAVLPFINGRIERPRLASVERYLEQLGTDPLLIRELHDLVHHHLRGVLACMLRENVTSIHDSPLPDVSFLDYFLPYRDHPDPDLVARHNALENLPPETLGNHYFHWYQRNNFPFPGDPMGLTSEFAWPHDTAHLLSGYNTTPHGELLVSTFTAGMHPENAIEAHVLPVIFSWHLGIKLNDVAKSATGAFDPELFWEAWDRGSQTTVDVFKRDWDFWTACETPLSELRAVYGVPPSAFPADRVGA